MRSRTLSASLRLSALTMVAVVTVVSAATLVSCTSAEERARQRQVTEQYVDSRYSEIRERLNIVTGGVRQKTFKYRGPRSGWSAAYEFVSNIGGSLLESGSGEFTLDVDLDRDVLGRDYYAHHYTAKIIDNNGPNRTRVVVMSARWSGTCIRCRDVVVPYLYAALLAME